MQAEPDPQESVAQPTPLPSPLPPGSTGKPGDEQSRQGLKGGVAQREGESEKAHQPSPPAAGCPGQTQQQEKSQKLRTQANQAVGEIERSRDQEGREEKPPDTHRARGLALVTEIEAIRTVKRWRAGAGEESMRSRSARA